LIQKTQHTYYDSTDPSGYTDFRVHAVTHSLWKGCMAQSWCCHNYVVGFPLCLARIMHRHTRKLTLG